MNNIWKTKIDELYFINKDEIGIKKRLNVDEEEIFSKIKQTKANINYDLIIHLYYELLNKVEPNFEYLVNSDISAHEYIIGKDKNYWIDFEKFKIGDPNNDLARSFQSITNVFFEDGIFVEDLYNIYRESEFFNETTFLYYLIEKLICSIYDAPSQIKDEEIEFYLEFISCKLQLTQKNGLNSNR